MLLPDAKPFLRQSASAAGEAVRRAVRRHDAALAAAHHAGGRQLGHRVHRVLGGVHGGVHRALADVGGALADLGRLIGHFLAVGGRLVAEVVHAALGAAQMVAEVGGAAIEPAADRLEQRRTGPAGGRWRRLRRRRAPCAARRRTAPASRAGATRHAAAIGGPPTFDHGPNPGPGLRMATARNCPNPMAKLRLNARLRTSIAQPPHRRRGSRRLTVTQNPSRSSMMARAWGP